MRRSLWVRKVGYTLFYEVGAGVDVWGTKTDLLGIGLRGYSSIVGSV